MNYDQARQLANGGWHWTTMNDGVVRTAAPCLQINEAFDPTEPFRPPKPENVHRCAPHATQDEAERHFYDWSLSQVIERTASDWHGCEECDAPTKQFLGNQGMALYFAPVFLCDVHRTLEVLQRLRPFNVGFSIIHS